MNAVLGGQNLRGQHIGSATSQDECGIADGDRIQVSASGWQVSDHARYATRIDELHDRRWGSAAATEDHHGAIQQDAGGIVNWHRQLARSANVACGRIKRQNLTRRRSG
ncbi:MAG: hypothetical protein ABI458_06725 [Chloroflexota bacterium]